MSALQTRQLTTLEHVTEFVGGLVSTVTDTFQRIWEWIVVGQGKVVREAPGAGFIAKEDQLFDLCVEFSSGEGTRVGTLSW